MKKGFVLLLLWFLLAGAEEGARYLIVAPDSFVSAAFPLVHWKTAKGMLAKVVPTSETGTDTASIRSYIRYAWNNWDIPPEYVLLLGGPTHIPSLNYNNDNYYGDMSGNYLMEIPVGRFPAQTVRDCSTFVAKVLAYENPPADIDTLWFYKGTTVVREDVPPDSFYQKDARILRQYWVARGFALAESLCDLYGDSSREVNAAAHDGRLFITYRGSGVSTWHSPFNAVDATGWGNGAKMPVVVSGTCATITLAPGESMYGDRFVRAGSPGALGGAIAFFGTTRSGNRLSRYRSACFRGFFHSLYEEGEYRLGKAALRGKFWVDSIYGDSVRYLEWNLLGDPELNVWTGPVKTLQVAHDTVVLRKPQNFVVTVQAGGVPVPNAVVCVSMDSTVYEYTSTNSQGQAIFEINPVNTGSLQIVVTGKDLRPYIGSCEVVVKDVASTAILAPVGVVDSGMGVTPVVKLFNYGSRMESYPVRLRIGTNYCQVETVYFHQPNTENELVFPRWYARERGSLVVSCSTELRDDVVPENDRDSGAVFVRVRDVAVSRVVVPVDRYPAGSVITPVVAARNPGNVNATYQMWLMINNAQGQPVYTAQQNVVNQPPGDSELFVTFAPCSLNSGGRWAVRCSVYYPFDQMLANNIKTAEFWVIPVWQAGWHEVVPMPAAPSGAAVKDGGWIAADENSGVIYAGKGNKTGDFYAYEPFTDTWRILSPILPGREERLPKKGARGVADGAGRVYLVKGNNSRGFWCYHAAEDRWEQLSDIPLGNSGKGVKGGGDMLYLLKNDTGYLYLLKGYYRDFMRYNIATGEWSLLPDAPMGKWKEGSWLVYDGANNIYAHRANSEELWVFDISRNGWSTTPLPGIPRQSTRTGKSKKSKDGSAAAYYDGCIYALKGGNTAEFWCYRTTEARWEELDTIPQLGSTGKKKRVKAGGDIAHFGGGVFFALKGNKTLELWRYVPAMGLASGPTVPRSGVKDEAINGRNVKSMPTVSSVAMLERYLTELAGQGGAQGVRVWIRDITGRVVAEIHSINSGKAGESRIGSLTPGVYFLQLETDAGYRVVKKVTVVR